MFVLFLRFTFFAIVEILAHTAFISCANYWSYAAAITLYARVGLAFTLLRTRINLIGIIWLAIFSFFLFLNDALNNFLGLLLQWLLYHTFNRIFLLFPKLLFDIAFLWRFRWPFLAISFFLFLGNVLCILCFHFSFFLKFASRFTFWVDFVTGVIRLFN